MPVILYLTRMAQMKRVMVAARSMSTMSKAASTSASLVSSLESTMPPGFTATIGKLETFTLPEKVSGSVSDKAMARAMIGSWRRDGILQIRMSQLQRKLYREADAASRRFLGRPTSEKRACIDARSYSGYIASGEEITDGVADHSKIFTVCKDLLPKDTRVLNKWPCHGPCPWPDRDMKEVTCRYMSDLGASEQKLLQIIEIGLDVPTGSLTRYTNDGWHHMRVLRFPARHRTNGKGKAGRGIGSHTDYGLLVIAGQDAVGGLFVRPPRQDEKLANWTQSSAGAMEDAPGWVYVPPVEGTLTVFPGGMLQYMTNNVLQSTPHKVGLNIRERFAFAYFHEPNFRSVIKPLPGYNVGQNQAEGIHYGTHFTKMCLRNYPDHLTTKRLIAEGRYQMLRKNELRSDA